MAGDHNGIINICAHLDGVYDQIAQEEKRFVLQIRERKINPDTALDDHNEQYREPCGIEGKQQDNDDKQGGEDTDQQIVLNERRRQVIIAGGVANHIHIFSLIKI